MKIIAIIPARYDSKRFPGKLLAEIKTKPLLQWVYERALKSGIFDQVCIASSDEKILNLATSLGATCFENKLQHRCGSDRCAEAAHVFDDEDIIINIQGDELFYLAEDLENVISAVQQNPKNSIITLSCPIKSGLEWRNPDVVKVVTNFNSEAISFTRTPISSYSRQKKSKLTQTRKHVGIYAFRNSTLQKIAQLPPTEEEIKQSLEQLRWMENGYLIHVVHSGIIHQSINRPRDMTNLDWFS